MTHAGARAVFRVSKPARLDDTTVVLHVCAIEPRGAQPLGSYHLELIYDSSSARVVSSAKPSSGMRVDNTGVPGLVSFAGASTSGFPDGLIETVVLRVKRRSVPALGLRVVEANSVNRRVLNPIVKIDGPALKLRIPNPGSTSELPRVTHECAANAPPEIHTVIPAAAPASRYELSEVRITGCGFSALNTVIFGPVTVNQVPSKENGALIIFMIAKETRMASEPPSALMTYRSNAAL